VTARLRVELDAVPENRVPGWIEGHEHATDELAVVEEGTHCHESSEWGEAHVWRGDAMEPWGGDNTGRSSAIARTTRRGGKGTTVKKGARSHRDRVGWRGRELGPTTLDGRRPAADRNEGRRPAIVPA
jgi:hypothetical protein